MVWVEERDGSQLREDGEIMGTLSRIEVGAAATCERDSAETTRYLTLALLLWPAAHQSQGLRTDANLARGEEDRSEPRATLAVDLAS